MKKFIISALIILMVCTAVFAETQEKVVYDEGDYALNFAFQPTLSRYNAMGQSGLALQTRLDSFFSNPAVLGKNGFAMSIPSVSVTLYNLEKIVSDPESVELYKKITGGSASDSETVKFATKLLSNLGTGRNLVATIDVGAAMKLGIFGFGTNAQVKLHGLNNGTSIGSQSIIPEINVAQTVAFGLRLIDTSALSLSAGASVHAVYKTYMQGIDAATAANFIGGSDVTTTLLWNTPTMAGYAIPFDLGVNIGFLDDVITLSATANNINGIYYMKSYSALGDVVNKISKKAATPPEGYEALDSESFKIKTPWSLNFGFAFAPDVPVLNPVLTADLVDMFELCKSFGSWIKDKENSDFRASDLLLHLNLGAEIGVFDIVTLRGGINRGYLSLGAGLWLPFMQVEASYGWQEFGNQIGDKPVDSLTIKFSLGYDKK
ncbi:MAG: hypothetical protein J5800_03745 [Spirochaetales bacterium]|nr:hypothetical protein [Spirochaetales bacterium]